jgi:hypothetical protein
MFNVDHDHNSYVEYRDFLIATILTDYHSMMGYFKIAYSQLFQNPSESIQVQELAN